MIMDGMSRMKENMTNVLPSTLSNMLSGMLSSIATEFIAKCSILSNVLVCCIV